MERVSMPQLGETVTEGTILAWLKQPGDRVEPDDALFEVSTDKVDTEVPSAVGGWLRAVLVEEGRTVPVGTVVALITETEDEPFEHGDADRAAPEAHVPAPAMEAPAAPGPAAPSVTSPPAGSGGATEVGFLSPAVRALLAEHGLDPSRVRGSGRDGRITRNDVLAAAANRGGSEPSGPSGGRPVPVPVAGPGDDVVDFNRARRNTAAHMVASLATSAHALVVVEVDYTNVDAVRRASGLSYLPFVARAVVDAVAEFPHVNASVGDDELIVHPRVDLGIAVDVDFGALVVPVVRDAGGLRLRALGEAVADLARRARAKRLSAEDMTAGTFTLTNVGSYGTLVTAPIINQPQVAILSTDGVAMRPTAIRLEDGSWGLAVHPLGNLCLSFDHRAFDGAYASAFLARVRELLETRPWAEELG